MVCTMLLAGLLGVSCFWGHTQGRCHAHFRVHPINVPSLVCGGRTFLRSQGMCQGPSLGGALFSGTPKECAMVRPLGAALFSGTPKESAKVGPWGAALFWGVTQGMCQGRSLGGPHFFRPTICSMPRFWHGHSLLRGEICSQFEGPCRSV